MNDLKQEDYQFVLSMLNTIKFIFITHTINLNIQSH